MFKDGIQCLNIFWELKTKPIFTSYIFYKTIPRMQKGWLFVVGLSCASHLLKAQQPQVSVAPLSQYIQQALDSNLVLKHKQVSLAKSMAALEEAKSYFVPHLQLLGNYTLARGGRQIIVPVGDLLNPVYTSLNQLTGSMAFPQIGNAREQFLPNNFYDVRVRTSYGVVSPERRYHHAIKQQEVLLSELEIDVYKKELTKEIKTAYYSYMMAQEVVGIYASAREVVARAFTTSQSLLANGKGLPAAVHRSKAEVQQVEAQWLSAQNDAATARAFFNYLLNRNLQDSIIITPAEALQLQLATTTTEGASREEIAQLQAREAINSQQLKLYQSYQKPRLNSFVDVGAQAFNFAVDRNAPYYLAGLQLEIPIFSGKKNSSKIEQAQLSLAQSTLQKEQVRKQIELAQYNARQQLHTMAANYTAAQEQAVAARSYFQLIDRGRAEGINSLIEWLDARNVLTQAAIQVQISKYKYLIAQAAYEREVGD